MGPGNKMKFQSGVLENIRCVRPSDSGAYMGLKEKWFLFLVI